MQQTALATQAIPLAAGELHLLAQPYVLDGRPVSTHPRSVRGYSQFNSYLIVSGDEALLIDTGLSIHESSLLEALGDLLDPEVTLSMIVLRISEFAAVSNARAIADRFKLGNIMTPVGALVPEELNRWLDYTGQWRQPTGGGNLESAGRLSLSGRKDFPIGPGQDPATGRKVEIVRPKLQFIPTTWLYDPQTHTMFTSDVFTHVWREDADGPWVVTEADDSPTAREVADYLEHTRYWWLAGADVGPLRADVAAIRENHRIDCIAPAFGCALLGREVVDRHLDLMDEALVELSGRPVVGPDLIPYYQETR